MTRQPPPTRAEVELLTGYVIDHASDHEDACPGDDTCDCEYAPRNAAVNRICGWLAALPASAPAVPVERNPAADMRREGILPGPVYAAPPAESAPPVTPEMPVIEVGDTVVTIAGHAEHVARQDHADYWNDGYLRPELMRAERIAAIYRTPLWRKAEAP